MSDEPPPFDDQKWMHELKRRDAERTHDREDALADHAGSAAIAGGQAALRTAVVINGGAAAAMLAFIGSLASVDTAGPDLGAMAASLIWFSSGVAAAILGMGFAYMTNYCAVRFLNSQERAWEYPYVQEGTTTWRWRWATSGFHGLAVIAGLGSVGLFIAGMLHVEASISLWNTLVQP